MKLVKWLIALMGVMIFVGCGEKTNEEKAEDAAKNAQKDIEKAAEGVEVPSLD